MPCLVLVFLLLAVPLVLAAAYLVGMFYLAVALGMLAVAVVRAGWRRWAAPRR